MVIIIIIIVIIVIIIMSAGAGPWAAGPPRRGRQPRAGTRLES